MSVRSLTIASFGAAACLALVYLGLGMGLVGRGAAQDGVLAEDAASIYRTAFVAVSVLSIALSVVAAFVFGRRVVEPIGLLAEAADEMAGGSIPRHDGDGYRGIVFERKDELGLLAAAMNRLYLRLREEASLSRDIIDEATFPAVWLDVDGNITGFNPAASRVTGFTEAEAVALAWPGLITAASTAAFDDARKRASAGERVRGVEIAFVGKDGDARAMRFNALPATGGRKAAGCVFIGCDSAEERGLRDEITEARAQARESSEKLGRTVKDLEEFALLAVRRELKMREIRERLIALKERASGRDDGAEDLTTGQGG
jgi:PAS domain S-box-containing protein